MPPSAGLLHFYLSNELFKSRRSFEANVLGGLDLDCLSSSRIAAGTGSTLRHGECTQVGEGKTTFLLEISADEAKDLLYDFLCLHLGQLVVASYLVDDFAFIQLKLLMSFRDGHCKH